MAWLRNLSLLHNKTLQYFDKYDYPLTKEELEYWSGAKVQRLPNRPKLEKIRKQREKYSLLKWGIAYAQAAKLAKLPFIAAIFVTGSLAMSNCKKSDDIDLMIITYPNTLWIARLIVTILLFKSRRTPNVKFAPNKICTNLWLDTKNLKLKIKNLYIAHEILQAKCIFDRGGVQYQFLKQNSWVKDCLPNAYRQSIGNLKFKIYNLNSNFKLQILNYILFFIQYLYMLPKKTTEKVGLGYAFFHPKNLSS
ncbi:hypothetical protein HZB69_04780 [Candidatus Amesbacteria bacterium]|nr:hypothetical protein [Candidatus Amesbacteria bacterium]